MTGPGWSGERVDDRSALHGRPAGRATCEVAQLYHDFAELLVTYLTLRFVTRERPSRRDPTVIRTRKRVVCTYVAPAERVRPDVTDDA